MSNPFTSLIGLIVGSALVVLAAASPVLVWQYDRHFVGWSWGVHIPFTKCCKIGIPAGGVYAANQKLATLQAAERAAQAYAQAVAIRDAQITAAAAQHDAAAQQAIVIRYRTITREVHDVVTPAIDARYPLPVGFVRVHDAAALGLDLSAIPSPAGEPDDAASSVTASDAAATITANYGRCRSASQQLIDLQAWLRSVSAANTPTTK